MSQSETLDESVARTYAWLHVQIQIKSRSCPLPIYSCKINPVLLQKTGPGLHEVVNVLYYLLRKRLVS